MGHPSFFIHSSDRHISLSLRRVREDAKSTIPYDKRIVLSTRLPIQCDSAELFVKFVQDDFGADCEGRGVDVIEIFRQVECYLIVLFTACSQRDDYRFRLAIAFGVQVGQERLGALREKLDRNPERFALQRSFGGLSGLVFRVEKLNANLVGGRWVFNSSADEDCIDRALSVGESEAERKAEEVHGEVSQ